MIGELTWGGGGGERIALELSAPLGGELCTQYCSIFPIHLGGNQYHNVTKMLDTLAMTACQKQEWDEIPKIR